ncbi:hypothetical protein ACS0TY_006304 [Phlomoides rotata]
MLERDLTEGLHETRPIGDQAQGEELNTTASDDDQEMIDASVQEAGTSHSVDQQVEVSDQVQTLPPDLEPRIWFEPMEIENELDPTGPIIDPQWKPKKRRATPVEELETIKVDPSCQELEVFIGSKLPEPHRANLINILKTNIDVFAWSHEDMVGIDPKHAYHRLHIEKTKAPIKQKRRKFGP